jgi:hypothetical protein
MVPSASGLEDSTSGLAVFHTCRTDDSTWIGARVQHVFDDLGWDKFQTLGNCFSNVL